ncbi:hypothetical protein SVIOM74S_09098 [Streptomyces violarus]
MVVPSALTRPPRAWPDSTRPMAARSCQGRLQPGLASRSAASAFLYASRTVAGMPASEVPGVVGPVPVLGDGLGLLSGGRSV